MALKKSLLVFGIFFSFSFSKSAINSNQTLSKQKLTVFIQLAFKKMSTKRPYVIREGKYTREFPTSIGIKKKFPNFFLTLFKELIITLTRFSGFSSRQKTQHLKTTTPDILRVNHSNKILKKNSVYYKRRDRWLYKIAFLCFKLFQN